MHRNDQDAGSTVSVRPWSGLVGLVIVTLLMFLLPLTWWLLVSFAILLITGIAARYIEVLRSRTSYYQRKHACVQAQKMFSHEGQKLKKTLLVRPIQMADKIWTDVSPVPYSGYSQLPLEEIVRIESLSRGEQLICVDGATISYTDVSRERSQARENLDKNDITSLLHQAERVYVLPNSASEDLWFAASLKSNGLLGKTVFIMPRSRLIPFERYAHYWSQARALYESVGIELVEYNHLGGLLILKETNCTPFFFVEPAHSIDGSLFNIASMLIEYQRSMSDQDAFQNLKRIKAKLQELRRVRFRTANAETWSRYLFSPDKVFFFRDSERRRLL